MQEPQLRERDERVENLGRRLNANLWDIVIASAVVVVLRFVFAG
jgi:hypothetical protein